MVGYLKPNNITDPITTLKTTYPDHRSWILVCKLVWNVYRDWKTCNVMITHEKSYTGHYKHLRMFGDKKSLGSLIRQNKGIPFHLMKLAWGQDGTSVCSFIKLSLMKGS